MSNSDLTLAFVLLLLISTVALVLALLSHRALRGDSRSAMPTDVHGLSRGLDALRRRQDSTLRRPEVVRYDAFGDMGGRLSWSMALLDQGGTGLVLTSIHGRSDARTYAKKVTEWQGDQPLSPEEEEAVGLARSRAAA